MNFSKLNNLKSIPTIILLLIVLFVATTSATAQTTSSPYSRYGIGDISRKGLGQGFAMGGTFIGLQNDTTQMFFINNGNPASYSNMRLVTAELGANYNRLTLQDAVDKKTVNTASLSHIALAFQIKKWWGASVGLVPFSSVGYKISDEQDIANIGTVKFLYEGKGGINQVYFGNGIKPLYALPRNYQLSDKYRTLKSIKHADNTPKTCQEIFEDSQKIRKTLNRKKFMQSLSLGANASYLFGNMENTRRSVFPSTLYAFNTRTGTNTRVDGLYFDYGLQMSYTIDSVKKMSVISETTILHNLPPIRVITSSKDTSRSYKFFERMTGKNIIRDTTLLPDPDSIRVTYRKDTACPYYKYRDLKENVKIMFGATFSSQTNMEATIDSLSYSYFNNSIGYEIVKDTIENTKGHQGKITIPMSFGFGIAIKKGDKWMIAADIAIQNWSDYSAFGQSQGLKNSLRTSLGAQFIPDSRPSATYFKRAHYRLGVRYMQTALELKSTPLNEYAGSFGIGFPVGRSYILQSFSMVNIGVEVGQRGTLTNGLIKENFIKASVGFTINDRWFQKPKFD